MSEDQQSPGTSPILLALLAPILEITCCVCCSNPIPHPQYDSGLIVGTSVMADLKAEYWVCSEECKKHWEADDE